MAFGGEDAESYYDDGLTASMKGDVHRAVACFVKAVELDGAFVAAHHQLAKCYLRMGDGARAVEVLKQVVLRKPDQIPPRVDLGYALLATGDPQEARKQFDQLVALDPGNVRGQLGLAHVCFDEGNWPLAVVHADTALAAGGANFAALFVLGRAARLAGDPARGDEALNEAGALIEKSVELNPDQPEGHYLRGEVCFAREQFSGALEHYASAERWAEPDRVYSAFGEHFVLADTVLKQGLCFQRLGKNDKARAIGKRVLGAYPDHRLAQSLAELE